MTRRSKPPAALLNDYKRMAVHWSRTAIRNSDNFVLDLETTGPDPFQDRIVQVGIITIGGETVIDALVNPGIEIPDKVVKVHGITNEAVANAHTFADIHQMLWDIMQHKVVLIYNVGFDATVLQMEAQRHRLKPFTPAGWYCVMKAAASFVGEWNPKHQDFKWQNQHKLITRWGIPREVRHQAVADCHATLGILRHMAMLEEQENVSS